MRWQIVGWFELGLLICVVWAHLCIVVTWFSKASLMDVVVEWLWVGVLEVTELCDAHHPAGKPGLNHLLVIDQEYKVHNFCSVTVFSATKEAK